MPGPGDFRVRVFPAALDNAVRELVLKNRENLIRAAVPDVDTQAELVEINKRIEQLRVKDPDLVGAWGLGCGAGCRTRPGESVMNPR